VNDSSAVDAAVIGKLAGDPVLSTLLPDGVFVDISRAGATRFVLVSLITHEDADAFTTTAYERFLYLVKAVAMATSAADVAADVKGAAFRIHELLQRAPLTITGYAHMSTVRTERIRYTEVDAIDSDIRWQHRGGHYEVFVSPNG